MKYPSFRILFVFLIFSLNYAGGAEALVLDETQTGSSSRGLVIASQTVAADILIDSRDSKTVALGAQLFADDLERVTGKRPQIKRYDAKLPDTGRTCIIVGSLGQSRLIQDLFDRDKIDVSEIKGEWEACLIEVVKRPFPGIKEALVIAGSDLRPP
jgi:hypothetical protein